MELLIVPSPLCSELNVLKIIISLDKYEHFGNSQQMTNNETEIFKFQQPILMQLC